MKEKQRKWLRTGLFVAVGALAGLLYYTFFGCKTTCPITADPWRTMAFTGVMGALMSVVLGPKVKEV